MAITRPIDTLYIKLAIPINDFSREIIDIGKKCGAEILYDDPINTDNEEDLPF